ncbi:MAG: YraN family protein [Gammaproteobacteria bacterium]|nr:YraN family protein [Gammaproteobacteria bacterium]
MNKKNKGELAEQKAYDFLQSKGLQLIIRNYRCAHGEIDLIMIDKTEIVFVEVRSRARADYGYAEETVDRHKQKKLIHSAMHFLQEKNGLDTFDCRFDVIGFLNNKIEWIKNAFIYE